MDQKFDKGFNGTYRIVHILALDNSNKNLPLALIVFLLLLLLLYLLLTHSSLNLLIHNWFQSSSQLGLSPLPLRSLVEDRDPGCRRSRGTRNLMKSGSRDDFLTMDFQVGIVPVRYIKILSRLHVMVQFKYIESGLLP